MKSFKTKFTFAAAAIASLAGFTGCQDNFDVPPLDIPEATMQSNTTIAELKEAFWDDAVNYATLVGKKDNGEDYIVRGRVISSDASGNIYKSLVIQDETGALPMSINQNSMYNSYRVGQEIVVNVTDIYCGKYAGYEQLGALGSYNGTPQTSFMDYAVFTEHSELNGLPEPEITYVLPDAPRPTSGIYALVADMGALPSSGDPEGVRAWQGQLVVFRGVHFEGGGELTYANADNNDNESRNLLDTKGNSIVVRNSGYANFKGEVMPAGTGDVRGILSYFNGTWQLLLRTLNDVMFDTKGNQDDPYTIEEAIEKQGNGIMGWTQGYIVGSVKGGVSSVTSNSDIIWSDDAEMDNNLVIGATADTKDISKCAVVSLPQGSAFRQYGNLADNPGVYGKKISVYGALENLYGMAGITDNTGTASEFSIEGVSVPGAGEVGAGSESEPYNVSYVAATTNDKSDVWVEGYMVGYVNGVKWESGATFSNDLTGVANSSDTGYANTNLILGATANTTSTSAAIPVQLPRNVRETLGLRTNPTIYMKHLKLQGDITMFLNTRGLKNVTAYKILD